MPTLCSAEMTRLYVPGTAVFPTEIVMAMLLTEFGAATKVIFPKSIVVFNGSIRTIGESDRVALKVAFNPSTLLTVSIMVEDFPLWIVTFRQFKAKLNDIVGAGGKRVAFGGTWKSPPGGLVPLTEILGTEVCKFGRLLAKEESLPISDVFPRTTNHAEAQLAITIAKTNTHRFLPIFISKSPSLIF